MERGNLTGHVYFFFFNARLQAVVLFRVVDRFF
jgi:hypothetical protein